MQIQKQKIYKIILLNCLQSQTEIESGTINLGKADIESLVSVKMSSDFSTDALSTDVDITDRFELDNGQRDNFMMLVELN